MRLLAVLLGAAVVAAAATPPPADAKRGAKPLRFAAKRSAKRTTSGWRAAPRVVVVVPAASATATATATPEPVEEAPVVPAGEPAPPPPPVPACDPSPWLGAIAEDVGGFRLRLTRTCVPAGTVLFQFRNTDLAEHNLWAEGVAPVAAKREIVPGTPGETIVTASATLAAGTWRLYCSFEGHEAMSRLVDVTPAG